MAARATNDAFISIMDAKTVRPGLLLCSVADLYKSDWLVESVATRVHDRWMEVVMRPAEGGKPVTRHIDPEDIIARKVYKSQF